MTVSSKTVTNFEEGNVAFLNVIIIIILHNRGHHTAATCSPKCLSSYCHKPTELAVWQLPR